MVQTGEEFSHNSTRTKELNRTHIFAMKSAEKCDKVKDTRDTEGIYRLKFSSSSRRPGGKVMTTWRGKLRIGNFWLELNPMKLVLLADRTLKKKVKERWSSTCSLEELSSGFGTISLAVQKTLSILNHQTTSLKTLKKKNIFSSFPYLNISSPQYPMRYLLIFSLLLRKFGAFNK